MTKTTPQLVLLRQAYHDRVFDWLDQSDDATTYRTHKMLEVQLPDEYRLVVYRDSDMAIHNGWLFINPWFEFDGASGPAVDGVSNLLASLIHDALGRAKLRGCVGYSYRQTHSVYRDRMLIEGASKLRAYTHWILLVVGNPWYRLWCRIIGKDGA